MTTPLDTYKKGIEEFDTALRWAMNGEGGVRELASANKHSTLSLLRALREEVAGREKDTTPYSGNNTMCCGEPEAEGEDGYLFCSECKNPFPKLLGSEYNQALSDTLAIIDTLISNIEEV